MLAEAVRNAHKHAGPTQVEVSLEVKDDDTLVLDVINDGVRGKTRQHGMGLKLAALEALQFGGIIEFGERDPGMWRVRLAVPIDRPDLNPSRIAAGTATASCACSSSTTTRSCTGDCG